MGASMGIFARLILLVSLTSFTACGLSEMKDNAKKASDNSRRAAEAAEQSREEIANSRLLGRAGAASEARRQALESLMSAESFEMKTVEASKLLKAFEFQMWTSQKYDTPEYLDVLYKEGLDEFFRTMVEINAGESLEGSELHPFDPTSSQSRYLSVYAIAASLHKVHTYAEHMVTMGMEELQPISMIDLFE